METRLTNLESLSSLRSDNADFVESEHPRGQPDNPGQFVKGAGGGSKKVNQEEYESLIEQASPAVNNKKIEKSLREYSRMGYGAINNELRHGTDLDYVAPVDEINQISNWLNSASFPGGVVYRNISKQHMENLKPGVIYKDRGFVSTSASEAQANNMSAGGTHGGEYGRSPEEWRMNIEVPEGAHAAAMWQHSTKPREKEVLLQRGSHFLIESVDHNSRTIHAKMLLSEQVSEHKRQVDQEEVKNRITPEWLENRFRDSYKNALVKYKQQLGL